MLLYLSLTLFKLGIIDAILIASIKVYVSEALREPEVSRKYNPHGVSKFRLLHTASDVADIYKNIRKARRVMSESSIRYWKLTFPRQ